MPGLAAIMLLGWPVVALVLFSKIEFRKAGILTVVAGYLLLPSHYGFDLPAMPLIDKRFIVGFSAVLGAIIFARRAQSAHSLPGWFPRSGAMWVLIFLIFGGAVLTVMTNGDRLVYEGKDLTRTQPGLTPYDGLSGVMPLVIALLPAIFARRYLADADGHRLLLTIVAIAALIYTLPALWEIRMSPHIHKVVYGFHGGQWRQNLRGDTFRPYVFLAHGLPLSAFFMIGILSSLVLWRSSLSERRGMYLLAALWTFMVLLLSKSLGSILIVFALAPVVLFLPRRGQMISAAMIVVLFLAYPAIRANNLISTEQLVGWAAMINERRAESLAFRFKNEDVLLERASERPVAGWGGWGRARVVDTEGKDSTVTDGGWIIALGEGGWMRFLGFFGVLVLPFLIMFSRRYKLEPATVGVIVVLMGPLINIIPNAAINPIPWLFAGALAGRLELGRASTAENTAAAEPSDRRQRPQLTRPASASGRPDSMGPVHTRQTVRHVRGES